MNFRYLEYISEKEDDPPIALTRGIPLSINHIKGLIFPFCVLFKKKLRKFIFDFCR